MLQDYNDYSLTLFEVCEILNKSRKTISRYIRQGRLHPEQIKSQQGTLEYRFSKTEAENLKESELTQRQENSPLPHPETDETRETEQTGQMRQDTPQQVKKQVDSITGGGEIISILREQLTAKDKQIDDLSSNVKELIERSRETNILLKGLQDKVLLLEQGLNKDNTTYEARQDTADRTDETDKTGETGQNNDTTGKERQDRQDTFNSFDSNNGLDETGQDRTEETRQDTEAEVKQTKGGFWRRLFK